MKKLSNFNFKLDNKIDKLNKENEELRLDFLKRYPISFIEKIDYKDYILG